MTNKINDPRIAPTSNTIPADTYRDDIDVITKGTRAHPPIATFIPFGKTFSPTLKQNTPLPKTSLARDLTLRF